MSLQDVLVQATPEELRRLQGRFDPYVWSTDVAKVRLPKAGYLDFKEHPFMVDVYRDTHPEVCVIKGAQLGFSTWAMTRAMWALTSFNLTVIYTFPTRDQVSEYTAARIDPLITGTPFLMERIVDVNSVRLKKFQRTPRKSGEPVEGVSLIYFSGAAKESDAIAVDADLVIHDEEDKSNSQVIGQYSERLAHSRFKWRIRLSTPTLPGVGVDRQYVMSDRRHWMVKCPSCNEEFELWFPRDEGDPRGNIEPYSWDEVLQGVTPRFKCHRCGATINSDDRKGGRWVAELDDKALPHGYRVSQMAAPWVSAAEILQKRSKYRFERDFWNLVIGIAWHSGVTAMTRGALEARMGGTPMQPAGSGCFMGVDVNSRMLDIIIERYRPDGAPEVIQIAREPWDATNDFRELDSYMTRYGISSCVIDRLPETGMASRFADRWNRPGLTRVWLSMYKDETANASSRDVKFTEPKEHDPGLLPNEGPPSVKAPRNEILTNVSDELLSRMVLPKFDGSMAYEEFIAHCRDSVREPVMTDDEDRELHRYQWVNTGPDHLFHALVYAYLARMAPRSITPPLLGLVSTQRSQSSGKANVIVETSLARNDGLPPKARRYQRMG